MSDERFGVLIPEAGGDAGLGAHMNLAVMNGIQGNNFNVVLIDCDENAPCSTSCNFKTVPVSTDVENYLDVVKDIVRKQHINLVLPTADFDSKTLADFKLALIEDGCVLAMSDRKVTELWEDKLAFTAHTAEISPRTYRSALVGVKSKGAVFGKPRYGVGSRGIWVIEDADLAMAFDTVYGDEYIFQEVLEGNQYTTDVLCSMDGQPLQAVTREVYRLKGGADVSCKVVKSTKMERMAMDLCERYEVIGAACFEFMFGEDGQPKLIDAQPRLSGAHRVTALAGLNIPLEIVNMAKGNEFEHKHITYGLKVNRTFQEVIVSG